ncbi:alpha/beta fold hydrolase [candidate division WWE3 bacterium]|jgi:UDP-N-acetylmuramyl pentapeptide synthase/alpha/beta superfamily hydrolase|uniref:Alpha/beta fold hydrolase n=1 Tax=candidate division WWE3 bacterium TaxID=2053526 RepID=A0A3A4ZDE0_UNCKA|nr:MAG: alpha/beta fold hydrolase [candidate division WWE3 bacterium]
MNLNQKKLLVQILRDHCTNIKNTSVDLETIGPVLATSDSRKCVVNSVFFATRLPIEKYEERYWYMYKPNPGKYFFDGQPFIDNAIKNGAKIIVCEEFPDKIDSEVAYFKVANVIEFMGIAAKALLENLNTKIIAVTGSSGKTTVVHCINTVLQNSGLNINKLYTTRPTPITLPEMVFNLALSTAGVPYYLVIELPADRKGAIEKLCGIAPPDISLVFNIKEAHSKTLGGVEGIIEAKNEIIKCQKEKGTVILNKDDPNLAKSLKLSNELKKEIVTFGIKDGDIKGKVLEQFDISTLYQISVSGKNVSGNISLLGKSGLYTALAAVSVGYVLKINPQTIMDSLTNFIPMPGRMNWHILENGRIKLFSNYAKGTPTNTKHLLELIDELHWTGKRILVLGDFDFHEEEEMDEKAWNIINSKFDYVILSGIKAVKYAGHLKDNVKIITVNDKGSTIKKMQALSAGNERVYIVVNGNLEFKHSELVDDFLHVMDTTNKNTTVLLHGWGTSAKKWKLIEDSLNTAGLPTVSMQLPGFDLEEPKEAWGIPEYADFVIQKLSQMNIGKPYNFIGHSFGGRLAIYIASKYPDLVNKLILTNAAGVANRKDVKTEISKSFSVKNIKKFLRTMLPEKLYDRLLEIYVKFMGSPDYKRATPLMRKTLNKVVNMDLTAYLNSIDSKTLIIWGDKDTMTPLYEGEKLHKGIKNSNFVVIKDAGHNTFVTHSKEWLNEVIFFLKEKERDA